MFAPEKPLKRGRIALFRIVRLKQGASLKPTLLLNRGLLNYLADVNKQIFCLFFPLLFFKFI